jgi:hypothetical protein
MVPVKQVYGTIGQIGFGNISLEFSRGLILRPRTLCLIFRVWNFQVLNPNHYRRLHSSFAKWMRLQQVPPSEDT